MCRLESGSGRTRIELSWEWCGDDLRVHIGGRGNHLGAVALVGRDPAGRVCSSVQRIPPHREDEIALRAAELLHGGTGRTTCVTAGIHLDKITPDEIEEVGRNALAAARLLAQRLGEGHTL